MQTRKNVTQATIDSMCRKHMLWLEKKKGGKKAVFKNMQGASPLSFRDKSLNRAEFINCAFTNCDFEGADLQHAVMTKGDYRWSKFRDAEMDHVNLYDADLTMANFRNAACFEANFGGAYLSGADLSNATMREANFSGADLRWANLEDATLDEANFDNAKMPPLRLPSSGQFRAFKKVLDPITRGQMVLELVVSGKKPRTASYVGNKCRCQKAKVVAAYSLDGAKADHPNGRRYSSLNDSRFIYTLGAWIEEPNYDGDPRVECAPGIHFFMTKEEALAYGT